MSRRKERSVIISWLLEDENPAIKYRTMTELLRIDANAPEVRAVYDSIWTEKRMARMLAKQDNNGVWNTKDFGNHTAMRYLTSLAENGLHQDPRIDPAVNSAISFLQRMAGGEKRDYDGCSDALVLRALVLLGYAERSDVRNLVEAYVEHQLHDGGFICKRLLVKKPDRKSCYKAAVAGLLLYAACHQKGWHLAYVDPLIEYFTRRDVFYTSDKRSLVLEGRPGWRSVDNFFPPESMRVGLPHILHALAVLGAGEHPAVRGAWELLDGKRDDDMKLHLEGTLTKQPFKFGKVGDPNKWMTLYAELAKQAAGL